MLIFIVQSSFVKTHWWLSSRRMMGNVPQEHTRLRAVRARAASLSASRLVACPGTGLLQQVVETAAAVGVPLSGENALQRYDHFAFDRIAESAFGHHARAGRLESLTFLRMGALGSRLCPAAVCCACPCCRLVQAWIPGVGWQALASNASVSLSSGISARLLLSGVESRELLLTLRCRHHAGDLMFDNWTAFSDFLRRMRTPPSEED